MHKLFLFLLRIVLTIKMSRKNICIQLFLEKQYLTHGEAWIKYLMNIYIHNVQTKWIL